MTEVGPAADTRRSGLVFFERGQSPVRDPEVAVAQFVETDPTNATCFVALSLLPCWTWSRVAETLRRGTAPSDTLDRMLQRHYRDQPGRRRELLTLARAALDRAAAGGIAPVYWQDASYPASADDTR